MAEFAVQGYTQAEIAEAVGVAPGTVSNTLRQPFARKYVIERMQKTVDDTIKEALEKAAPQAIARIITLAENAPNTKLGLMADQEILNRYLGKAVQPIKNTGGEALEKLTDAELATIASKGTEPPKAEE